MTKGSKADKYRVYACKIMEKNEEGELRIKSERKIADKGMKEDAAKKYDYFSVWEVKKRKWVADFAVLMDAVLFKEAKRV